MALNILDDEFLSIIRCPVTGSRLALQGDKLVAEVGGLKYPIRDGIPVLLAEEAELPAGVTSLEQFKSQYGKTS
jgi:uncharacterized protein YbaR (Trm112 family)